MNELQKAIEAISYESTKFPEEAFRIISENKREALPYLRRAIDKAIEERDELEDGYQLHFYAFFFLGEFQDKESFGRIMELIKLPGKVLEYLIGDATTSGLKDVLYNTYNGDLQLLKNTIMDEFVDEFVRAGLLEVMGQLYLDGVLEEKEWKDFIRQNIYCGEEYSFFYEGLGEVICRCHFVDMLSEIRYMLMHGLMSEGCMGTYDFCVDEMFSYRDYKQKFCESPMSAANKLKSWAMFEENDNPHENAKRMNEFEKYIKKEMKNSKDKNIKIGRNDKCPCGSGKKYKVCCMNKTIAQIDRIESIREREKWLKNYPYMGEEKVPDRVYLEDYFDRESIEIDKILYLGLMKRPGWVWDRNIELEENRKREYLILAFSMFKEKLDKENIEMFEEYDKKFSIHYFCEEWLEELLDLLNEGKNKELYNEVKNVMEQYCKEDKFQKMNRQNSKWKKFSKLTEKCYLNMIGAEKDAKCWEETFELLKEIILEERVINPNYATHLEMVDDVTDYEYDIQGWLEDCLDEMEMRGKDKVILKMCDDLLCLFDWPEYTGSDLKFRKSAAMKELGQKKEAAEYCREWIKEEEDNIVAAVAGVYAFIETEEFEVSEELVDKWILDKTLCTDDNDIMFTAASVLYGKMGKRKEKKQIDKALQAYDEYLESYFGGTGLDEEELNFLDEDLPF